MWDIRLHSGVQIKVATYGLPIRSLMTEHLLYCRLIKTVRRCKGETRLSPQQTYVRFIRISIIQVTSLSYLLYKTLPEN